MSKIYFLVLFLAVSLSACNIYLNCNCNVVEHPKMQKNDGFSMSSKPSFQVESIPDSTFFPIDSIAIQMMHRFLKKQDSINLRTKIMLMTHY